MHFSTSLPPVCFNFSEDQLKEMIHQLQGAKAAKQAALKKELEAKDKALADQESAIKDKEKQI